MRRALKLHPDTHCDAVRHIAVDAARSRSGSLVLRYFITGRIGDIRLAPKAVSARADELWRSTCFEAFIRGPGGSAYYEFNFAPSTQWAAYRFDGYRDGMKVASEIGAPRIEPQSNDAGYELCASLTLSGLGDLPDDAAWQLGLSAVIEETSGAKSWWALEHPPGKPDFHHPDCFALPLPPM